MNKLVSIALTAALGFAALAAQATEGGGSIYAVGNENFTCCAVPPPGLYGVVYAQSLSADKVRGNDGQVVTPPTFKVKAQAIAPRIVWVSPYQIGGGSLGLHGIFPLVNLDVNVAPGTAQTKSGLGDVVFGPFVGWHHSANLHTVAAIDLFAPTGQYDRNNLANIGRNYWAMQAIYGATWIDSAGFNVDAKTMYTINLKNADTQYRSGHELIIDYAAGWGFGNGLVAGIGGYLYHQMTNDELDGVVVANNKGRTLSIGPSFKYDSGKGWFLTLKYQLDTNVRNRAESKSLWLKAVFPL